MRAFTRNGLAFLFIVQLGSIGFAQSDFSATTARPPLPIVQGRFWRPGGLRGHSSGVLWKDAVAARQEHISLALACPNIPHDSCAVVRAGGQVSVIVDPRIRGEFFAAIQQALLSWASNKGAGGVSFAVSTTAPPSAADLASQINQGTLPDQTFYISADEPVNVPANLKDDPALTLHTPCGQSSRMSAATWLRSTKGAFNSAAELRKILTHEIGHIYGLADCSPQAGCPAGSTVMSLPLSGSALYGPTGCDQAVIDSILRPGPWPRSNCSMTSGSRMTYRICMIGTSDCVTDTMVWEAEPQKIDGRTVMRGYWLADPDQLKTYVACDAQLGLIEVGSEWIDLGNPIRRGLSIYDPPKQAVPYGASAGTSLVWQSNQSDASEITRILGYENTAVPAGTFPLSMKYEYSSYSGGSLRDGPVTYWQDANFGIIRGDDREAVMELVSAAGQPNAPTLADSVDLAVEAAHSGDFSLGQTGTITLTVTNVGRKASNGPIILTDILPAGFAFESASGSGWACQADGQIVTCQCSTSLGNNASTILNIIVRITAFPSILDPDKGADSLVSVQTGGEGNFFNNSVVDFIIVHAGGHQQVLNLSAGGSATASTAGLNGSTQTGYATVAVNAGVAPYGTAVFIFKQNGVTVSEAGVPASPPTTAARIFIDYRSSAAAIPGRISAGTVIINTGIAAVNSGSVSANVTYTLRNTAGTTIAIGHGTLAAGAHFAKFIDQLNGVAPDFVLPANFQAAIRFASLEISSDQPISILALRMTTNQRNEALFTTTPTADLTKPASSGAIYFPQFADGGGYTTSIVLLNTSSGIETGTLQVLDDAGEPLVFNEVGGTAGSMFPYSIPKDGVVRFQSDGFPSTTKVGWVKLTPDAGTSTPVGAGVFGYNPGNFLVTESGIPATVATTHARIFVDMSGGHGTGLAIGNPASTNATIAITAYQKDGLTGAGTSLGPLPIPANGHGARFADQFIAGLPAGFTGVLDIMSSTPFAALTMRSLYNERYDFLLATFPIADMTRSAPSPIVFPQIADGGGYVTQFILIGAGGASSVTLSFHGEDGKPLPVGK